MSTLDQSNLMSVKKKPIILTSTKTVTTTKTTRHICLGENGENFEMGLNDLQSFLEEEPKTKVVKKKSVLTPCMTSNRRMNISQNGESRKRKKKSQPAAVKAKSKHWNESDTDLNTTDEENGRRGLISSNDKENNEILSSTINTSGQSLNGEANDFWNEHSSPTYEPSPSEESTERDRKSAKRNRDINDIVEEAHLLPVDVDVTRNEVALVQRTTPRKLSAIFETSAEANATKCSSPSTLHDKSPLIEKMVSNHYNQIHNTMLPNISINEVFPHKIALDNSSISSTVAVPPARRTTRVFSSESTRANLYPNETGKDVDIASNRPVPSFKRKTRRNTKKSNKLQTLIENDKVVQSNRNKNETIFGPVDVPNSKSRRNTKKSTKTQPIIESAGVLVQVNRNENETLPIASPPVEKPKSKSRRNAKKLTEEQRVIENDIETVSTASLPVDASKSKSRRNTKNSTKTQPIIESADVLVQGNRNEIETLPIDSPPVDALKSKSRRNTKKSTKEQRIIENENETESIASPLVDQPKSKQRRNTKKSTKQQPISENSEAAIQANQNEIEVAPIASPPIDAHKSKSRRETKKSTKSSLRPLKDNDGIALRNNQNMNLAEIVTSPIIANTSSLNEPSTDAPKRKTRNPAKKSKTTNSNPIGKDAKDSDQNKNSNNEIAETGRKLARTKGKSLKQFEKRPLNTNIAEVDAITEIHIASIDNNESTKEDGNIETESIEVPKLVAKQTKQSTSVEPKSVDSGARKAAKRIASTIASPRAKRGKKNTKQIVVVNPNENSQTKTEAKKNDLLPSLHEENDKLNSNSKEEQKIDESILFEAPGHDIDVTQENDVETMSTDASNKGKRLIIYSPSRDKSIVKRIVDNRVIIPKSMVAKAINNPRSGVLAGMSDSGMIIDANERLLYAAREGDEINVKKEVKKGVDILEVLAKRRQSVFILLNRQNQ